MPEMMTQTAPFPHILAALVNKLSYREDRGWAVVLAEDVQRDKPGRHTGESRGLTLIVTRTGPDTYHPEKTIPVNHFFPVPPATYDERAWRRWLFDTLGLVDLHERMEDFVLVHEADGNGGSMFVHERPFAPVHAPGADPYTVVEYATDLERRTSFRGDVNPA